MRTLYLIAWAITRLLFLFFWSFAEPIGELMVWLKGKAMA